MSNVPRARAWRVLVVMACVALCNVSLACARSPQTSGGPTLTDTDWMLTELNGAPAVPGLTARSARIRLVADGGRMTGATGCNTMGGEFEHRGDSLRFSRVFTTKMACVDPAPARQEADFVRAIEVVDRYAINGRVLTLFAAGRAVARFTAAAT